ncbi:MAG: cobalamin biosynthesis protein CobW [Firmicutes bacterium HGW-Firmicutes-4]|jgi:G3E family GTPase|nr:MAG: cobalamin biosynthesis protein CobW [Firmicutes bacterium HGW-Firmicutes-4]
MNTSKMILFTGFLGSGKTSLLLKTARYLAGQEKQCAIIVNEVGEIGIDNLQMKKMGYDVWEIFGGCICCTLAVSLEETISNLTTNYKIEYILMEPSGAADPKALFGPLEHGGFKKDNLNNVFIMDPTRVEMFKAVLEPYLQSSIPLADLVVINKIDVASTAEIDASENVVQAYNPGAAIIRANLNELEDRQIELLIR